ncbi:putative DUF4340 domain-containing protein [Gammaproteobacteria bacterium]
MNRIISLLGVILAVQLLLAVFFGITTTGVSGVASSEPLINFEVKAVDRITIEQPKKVPLVVERRGNAWSLPALGDFSAFTVKVDGFLERMARLRKRLPVSTTATAIRRFKVSPADYEHKVMLSTGDKLLTTLWLGNSSGFRQVHIRANEEAAIYNVDFPIHEVTTDPNQWADKTALNVKADDIIKISLPDTQLARSMDSKESNQEGNKGGKDIKQPGKWQVDGLSPEEQLNTEEIETLVNRLANLSFDSVLGKENQAKYRQDTPVVTLSLTTQSGEQKIYVFSQPEQEVSTEPGKENKSENGKEPAKGTEYILKISTSPYYFKLADFMVKDLIEMKRDKLIKKQVKAVDQFTDTKSPVEQSQETPKTGEPELTTPASP